MRTDELLREYGRNAGADVPSIPWMRFVWMSAELLKAAKRERHTERSHNRECSGESEFIQDDLFGNDQEERR